MEGLLILNLARNALVNLPSAIGHLTVLQRLLLGCNLLETLPDSTLSVHRCQRT
jgi:hypothetical protein